VTCTDGKWSTLPLISCFEPSIPSLPSGSSPSSRNRPAEQRESEGLDENIEMVLWLVGCVAGVVAVIGLLHLGRIGLKRHTRKKLLKAYATASAEPAPEVLPKLSLTFPQISPSKMAPSHASAIMMSPTPAKQSFPPASIPKQSSKMPLENGPPEARGVPQDAYSSSQPAVSKARGPPVARGPAVAHGPPIVERLPAVPAVSKASPVASGPPVARGPPQVHGPPNGGTTRNLQANRQQMQEGSSFDRQPAANQGGKEPCSKCLAFLEAHERFCTACGTPRHSSQQMYGQATNTGQPRSGANSGNLRDTASNPQIHHHFSAPVASAGMPAAKSSPATIGARTSGQGWRQSRTGQPPAARPQQEVVHPRNR